MALMARRVLLILLCALAALSCVCSALQATACRPGERRMASELLYFGTARPNGTVSVAEWSSFLASAVTPRFPQGLSAWPATGQWQSADGLLIREDSFVLNLVHAGS